MFGQVDEVGFAYMFGVAINFSDTRLPKLRFNMASGIMTKTVDISCGNPIFEVVN